MPAHLERIRAGLRFLPLRNPQGANVEVLMRRLVRTRGNAVDVQIEQRAGQVLANRHAGLFENLTPCGGKDVGIQGIDVPARLQPLLQLGVKHKKDRRFVRRNNERARREVPRIVGGAGKRIVAGLHELQHSGPVLGFPGIDRCIRLQQPVKRFAAQLMHYGWHFQCIGEGETSSSTLWEVWEGEDGNVDVELSSSTGAALPHISPLECGASSQHSGLRARKRDSTIVIPLRDSVPSRRTPVVTWALIAINAAVFLFELTLSPAPQQRLFEGFGLIAARFTDPLWTSAGGAPVPNAVSIFASTFLHLNWAHLLANMWTLWIFGDNVEDRMGHARFLLFYLLTGLLAAIVHCLIHPHSTIPAIGASGSVAGVLGAYLMLFPRARIVVAIPVLFFLFFVTLPAIFYLLIWFGSQVVSGTFASLGGENISKIAWWAHTGAFLAGVTLCRNFLLPAPLPILKPRYEVHWPRLDQQKWPGRDRLPSHRFARQDGIPPALSRSSHRSASR